MIWVWIGFILTVVLLLALDLGVFHRKAHVVSVREAVLWSLFWVGPQLEWMLQNGDVGSALGGKAAAGGRAGRDATSAPVVDSA
jgi:hypothetical protein